MSGSWLGPWLGEGVSTVVETPTVTSSLITNYTELQTAIASWLNRDDLTDDIPAFIQLAEAQIARRLRKSTVRAALSLSSSAVVLPAACAELRSLRFDTSSLNSAIPVVTPETLAGYRSSAAGAPRVAAVVGNVLLLDRTPDQTYAAEIVYFSTLTPLSDSVATNDVLLSAPDMYLYGALKEAAPFLENDERVPLWTAKFEEALTFEELSRERSEYGASLRPVRLPVVFG